jgi:hypothetical protein
MDWLGLWSLLNFILYSDYKAYSRNGETRQPELRIKNSGKSTSVIGKPGRLCWWSLLLAFRGYICWWDVSPWGITSLVISVSALILFIKYISKVSLNTISQRISTNHTLHKASCTDSLPPKKTSYYHKNEWQHKHGQYNSRINECSKLSDNWVGK